MVSITLKNIPEDLHAIYKRRAKKNSRSLQAEILWALREKAESMEETTFLEVDEVAGMLKSKVKGVSVDDMNRGIDEMFRKTWKR